jgi:Cu+-exporting ATPase
MKDDRIISVAADSLATREFIDPVCGMQVDPWKSAGKFEYQGHLYHFCSSNYLEKFKREPTRFISQARTLSSAPDDDSRTSLTTSDEYTFPMHPEVRQYHPGVCPKCGMALEPVAPIQPVSKTEYVYPTHPQVVRSEPVNCPICGMTLEPRLVSAGGKASPELADMTRRFG